MARNFCGDHVNIKLKKDLGIFQGKIVLVSPDSIVIDNAFHNGIKMKRFNEVTIGKDEIEKIEFLQVSPLKSSAGPSLEVSSNQSCKTNTSPTNFSSKPQATGEQAKPIAILRKPVLSSSVKVENGNRKSKKKNVRNFELMQPDDFIEEGDFDFEFSNSLFNKKEIFREIDNEHENIFGTKSSVPDLVVHHKSEEKYRHDENVLDSMFQKFRNVQLQFKARQEYQTDEPGIIIPSIPQALRNRIQNLAESHGLSMERQNDFLARGTTELALNLLGGSRRLSPKNIHQWPKITVICDEPYNFKQSEVGLSCARQLASYGLKVMVYVKTSSHSDKSSKELELFTATGNDFTGNVKDLFASDLVIMSVTNMNQNSQIVRYIHENRAPVIAIDPPSTGISEILIKNSIFPILPLDDIASSCGKLHLVNISISEKFFKDAGIKYSPIFGSKFVIPLHPRN